MALSNDWTVLFGWTVPLRPFIHFRCFFSFFYCPIFTPKILQGLFWAFALQMKASTNRDVTIGQDWSPELIYWDEPGECNFSLPISHFRVVNSSYPRCVKAFKTTMELCVTEELAKWGFVGRINWLFGVEILVGCIVTKRNTEYCQHKGITCLCAQRTRDVKILSIHLNHFYAQHFLSHTRCRSEDVHHWSRCAGWPQLTGKCLIRSLRYQGIAASGPGWRLFQWRGRNWSEEIQNVSLEGSFNKTWEKKNWTDTSESAAPW